MVPEGWSRQPLGATVRVQGGFAFQSDKFSDHGIPIVRISSIQGETVDISDAPLYPEDPSLDRFLLRDGDILIAMSGATTGKIGRFKNPDNAIAAYLNQRVGRFLLKDHAAMSYDFLWQFLGMNHVQNIVSINAIGGAQPNVSGGEIESILIDLPPLAEQKRIAEVLGVWDRAIEVAGKQLDLARTQKRALMQTLLTPTRRFPGYEGQPWPMRPIGEVATEVSERNKDDDAYPVISCTKTVGFVNSLEYFKKQVFSDDLSGYKVIRRNQLGYPSNHVEEGSIGLQDLHDVALVSPIYTIFEPSRDLDPRFLFRVLKTDRYRQIFAAATNASVDRRGSLRWKAFATIKVPVPTREEQDLINEAGDCADAEIDALENNLTRLQAEKKALMQQLLTGQKRLAV